MKNLIKNKIKAAQQKWKSTDQQGERQDERPEIETGLRPGLQHTSQRCFPGQRLRREMLSPEAPGHGGRECSCPHKGHRLRQAKQKSLSPVSASMDRPSLHRGYGALTAMLLCRKGCREKAPGDHPALWCGSALPGARGSSQGRLPVRGDKAWREHSGQRLNFSGVSAAGCPRFLLKLPSLKGDLENHDYLAGKNTTGTSV